MEVLRIKFGNWSFENYLKIKVLKIGILKNCLRMKILKLNLKIGIEN